MIPDNSWTPARPPVPRTTPGDENVRRNRPLVARQRMLRRDVARLMAQDRRHLGLVFQPHEEPPVDDDVSAGEGEGVGNRRVQHPVPVVEAGPVGDARQPHPDFLDVRLELPVAVETALLLDGGSVRLRAQRRFLLLRERDDGELGPPGDRVDGAAVDGDGEQTDQNERGGERFVVPFFHGDSLRTAAFSTVSDHYSTPPGRATRSGRALVLAGRSDINGSGTGSDRRPGPGR